MSALQDWINKAIAASPHAAMLLDPPPGVIGGGDVILAAVGPAPDKVVYLGTRHAGTTLRVGFAARDRWANEEIEDAVESNGGTMTEFLEDAMEADDELSFEVQHFHDTGWFHFASDLRLSPEDFDTPAGHEQIWYAFDGYARAILPLVSGKKE